ncbi:hypothetical protein VNO78_25582 [Psophocarpus tetragonolobus]|uniref:Dirigent protein n=1 Tax=Psophocarpus tetragonolobus TaxID=3891 RepID=A0AAN9S666_PSOTE
MATQFFIVSLLISCLLLTTINAEETGFVGSLDRNTLGLKKKDKISHFRFFFHETFSGSDPTTVFVVPSLPQYNSSSSFGAIGVMDNTLTVGPEPTSKVVGRVEALAAAASKTEFNLLIFFNFILTEGKYNGSTITVLGRNRTNLKVREIPVVGGTGKFRFATGYAETNTIFFDPQTRSTIEYNIYVSHY